MQRPAMGGASLAASGSRGESVGASLANQSAIAVWSFQENNDEQHESAQLVAEMQNRPIWALSAGLKGSGNDGERRRSALLFAAARRAHACQSCQPQAEQG